MLKVENSNACVRSPLRAKKECQAERRLQRVRAQLGFSRQEYWSGVPLPSPPVMVYNP